MRSIFTRVWAILLGACLLAGCGPAGSGQAGGGAEDAPRLTVVATIFPQYDFARQIAGGDADVYMLLKPGEEVHSYEPTPSDIRLIQESDLFLCTGGENDVWVDNILDAMGGRGDGTATGPQTVRLVDLVDTYAEARLEGMMPEKGHDHEHGGEGHAEEGHDHAHAEEGHAEEGHAEEGHAEAPDVHDREEEEESRGEEGVHAHSHMEEPDEHVWTSPANCVTIIEKLTDRFCELDPAHAEAFRANGSAYAAQMKKLDDTYGEMVSSAPRRTIIFGDRFPFRYLAEEFGLECYAAFSGCSADAEPSAATIAFLIDKASEEAAPAIFKIEFSNGNIARAVAEAASLRLGSPLRVLQLHSCHNLTRDEFAAGETCLSLMEKNLKALGEALEYGQKK